MQEFSEKLENYIKKIEHETGRHVLIDVDQNFGLSGMKAAFIAHPTHNIFVKVSPELQGEQLEQSIAHEITHGLLTYKEGFAHITYNFLSDTGKRSIDLLSTMISDIVVNKMIQTAGFSPFADIYIAMVKKETKAARNGQSCYQIYQDKISNDRVMIFRYVMAWGFLKYYFLPASQRTVIETFVKTFKKTYPEQYKMAHQVKKIISQNDIFSSEGYNETVRQVLLLWNLDHSVQLKIF